jgi:hypothetical protein
MRGGSVAFSRCWVGHEHILLGSTLTPWALRSLQFVTANFPYWHMPVLGVACLNSNPRQNPWELGAPHLGSGFVAVNGCVSERGLECDEQLNDSC